MRIGGNSSIAREYGVQLVILLAVLIGLTATSPAFRGEGAVFSTLEGFGFLGVVALGVGVTMIAGELDLSAASIATLAAVTAIQASDLGLLPALLIPTAVGLGIGAIQGLVISGRGINSLVFTVGASVLYQGLSYIVSGGGPVQLTDFDLSDALLVRWGPFSPSSVTGIVLFIVIGVALTRTVVGREIFAIGGGRREALAAGVGLRRPMVTAFALSGGCAALAGAMAAIRGGSAAPNSFGSLLLTGVAAALIGGIALSGGRGSAVHVAIGVVVLSTISAGFAARGSEGYVTELVTGLVLIGAVGLQAGTLALLRRRDRTRAMGLQLAHATH
ncbi:ABC transporter permease [Pseudonocardia lutea]|uniref:Autoinducer 2 import system permease protein LsrD n=1 Tax=Pseudonocardia lutea TaxID=2172015 RepID=A0ABW1I1E2_9PSEU